MTKVEMDTMRANLLEETGPSDLGRPKWTINRSI